MKFAVKRDDDAPARRHVPVMVAEVCSLVAAHGPRVVVDATLGMGGHAEAILLATQARLIGIDKDAGALETARDRLERFGDRVVLRRGDFSELSGILAECGIDRADAIVADLGMSSYALDDPVRGFSFRLDGPLDMRMDRQQTLSAYDLVNEESETALADLIYKFGEERGSRRIARAIVAERRRRPLATTAELRAVVERALGPRRRAGAHPATRTFQALRIAVNHELESLARLLRDGPQMLAPGGRMVILAYHSLEDRAVKERFRDLVHAGGYLAVTGKAHKPARAEIIANPRARSARLRCIERGPA